ncbi:dihydrofolate reductase [Nocardia sp. CDC159]|uniref:dihydrofolate reductase n=1 Tax=Nocardia pulmonis TaxID=2951408 RepID=A0A9X2IZY4_9NOCA|nr:MULTISPECIES: dihydrofolate reductase [Nocardia]MCM6778612.1 dihydrofolate reductase [Nocardia pulmonis]MCM6791501.1 dihydrofolate reductase [Nocardia sp. CDC159]
MSSDMIETSKRTVGLIWAQTRGRVIGASGAGGRLPWDLPEYREHLLETVSDYTVVLGRKTWESAQELFGPLPNNRKIVVTRQPDWFAPGAERAASVAEALALTDPQEVWVLGGGEILRAAVPFATVIAVTELNTAYQGDILAPEVPSEDFMMTYTIGSRRSVNGRDDYVFRSYARK